MLNAVDRVEERSSFISNLSCQLLMFKDSDSLSLYSRSFIDTIMEVEDNRIAKRLSEIRESNYEESQIDTFFIQTRVINGKIFPEPRVRSTSGEGKILPLITRVCMKNVILSYLCV